MTKQNWAVPRRFERYAVDVRLAVTLTRDGKETVLRGRSRDICSGGVGATLSGDLALGETVMLEMTLPALREPLRTPAIVRFRSGFQCGLEFSGLTSEQRDDLKRLCMGLPVVS
jgi:hypothetical protein